MPSDPRLPIIDDRTKIDDKYQHYFDKIVETRGGIRGPFQMLLHSPELANRIANLGTYIRFEAGLPDSVREIAILTTARAHDCAFEWVAHEPIAVDAGVDPQTIDIIANTESVTTLPRIDAMTIRFCRELIHCNRVSEETYKDLESEFCQAEMVELTGTVGYYIMIACVLNCFIVKPDTAAPFEEN